MNAFFTALSFLTRIPVPLRSQPGSWSRSVRYYPAVGLVIGGMLAGFDLVAAAWFPPWVRGVLLLGLWVWLTGGLHLDGWMDTADGFGSYRPRERTLEIMKDSRVGAMGVIAAILLLLLKASALASTPGPLWIPLLAAPVIGRWALLPAIHFCPYLTQDGIGKGLREGLTPVSMAAALCSPSWSPWEAPGSGGCGFLSSHWSWFSSWAGLPENDWGAGPGICTEPWWRRQRRGFSCCGCC